MKRIAKSYFSKFGPSFKYILIIGSLLIFLLIWFAIVSNVQNTVNEYGSTENISEEVSKESSLDCSGKWANSPLCKERAQALLELKESTVLKQKLLDANIQTWNADKFNFALKETAKGDTLFREEFFGESETKYSEVNVIYKGLIDKSKTLTRKYIDEGFSHLKNENSLLAVKSFELALNIDLNNSKANQGLSRAKVLDDIILLMKEAEIQLKIGKLNIANQKISKALLKDSMNTKVINLNKKIKALLKDKIIQDNLSEAFEALKKKKFNKAESIFKNVLKIDPTSKPALSGIKESREGIKENKILNLQQIAKINEQRGNWKNALNNYKEIISINKNLDFALEGKQFANSVILFETELDRQLSKPQRLAAKQVFIEANQLYESSLQFKETGNRIQTKIIKLKNLLDKYNFKHTLTILSDKKTSIEILRRGNLGKFNSIGVKLNPGEYTLIGKRKGYITVRRNIQLREDAQIRIICEKEI